MFIDNAGRYKTARLRDLALLIALHCIMMGPAGNAWADDYFNPALLDADESGPNKADLSLYEKGPGLAPGKYRVDIYLNNQKKRTQEVEFISGDDAATLVPCLRIDELKQLGVLTDKFPALAAQNGCANFNAIPSAGATFDINQQRLLLSMPQTAVGQAVRGDIAPDEFDEGITALLLNYSYSGSQNAARGGSGETSVNDFLNLRPGVNVGPWRLRNYSTWSRSVTDRQTQQEFSPVYTYLRRDIVTLKSELTLGQSSSPADVFDSVPFTGAQLASDDDMLPDSLRGYAPVVRGIAHSNAHVTIRQNGYVIYESDVAAGAFEITDLYPTGSGGDLNVTVKETDGGEQHFAVPYASVPVLQREGHLKYSLTGGNYRAYDEQVRQTPFLQGTAIYGLPHGFTLYGGVQSSPYYHALALGVGKNVGDWGALSVDLTRADATLMEKETQQGDSWRVRYSKSIAATGTSFSVAGYRYNTDGFYTLQETLDAWRTTSPAEAAKRRRSRQEVTVDQPLGDTLGSLNMSFVKERYWNDAQAMASASLGYTNSWHGVSYSLNYSLNNTTQDNGGASTRESTLAFNVSVPLDRWLSNTWATYSQSSGPQGNTQNISLNGSALADNTLSWAVQQGHDRSGDATTLNGDYKGAYGELSGGYAQDGHQRRLNYGVQGGLVAHANGVTLSQPFGETIALVQAPGANDTAISNQTGVRTDFRGYTVVPNVSPYRHNTLALDTETLPPDADVGQAAQTVTPTRGAVVRAVFDTRVGARVLMTLLRPGGKTVPFGATAASGSETQEFIVGDDGQVFLTGLAAEGTLNVSWGNEAQSRCAARWRLPEQTADTPVINLTAQCS